MRKDAIDAIDIIHVIQMLLLQAVSNKSPWKASCMKSSYSCSGNFESPSVSCCRPGLPLLGLVLAGAELLVLAGAELLAQGAA